MCYRTMALSVDCPWACVCTKDRVLSVGNKTKYTLRIIIKIVGISMKAESKIVCGEDTARADPEVWVVPLICKAPKRSAN
jgi:hypothetical protein